MRTKFHYRTLLVSIVLMTSISGFAETGSSANTGSPTHGEGALYLPHQYPSTKRTPSRTNLVIYYADGCISLFSNFYSGEFGLRFLNNDTCISYEISLIEVGTSCNFELPYGEYEVTAESCDGMTFYGSMIVE